MVAAIGSGEAFERGRDFAAWLGLVPRQYNTGGRSILGRISKRGSKYLRTLLIQAAKVLLMRPYNWGRYSFGAWLTTASERLHRNKLAVALANKLAERTAQRQSLRYSSRGGGDLTAAVSTKFAIEDLHGTDR
jgi:transposase